MRPILFGGDGRLEIVAHDSGATRYASETHPTIQICVPMAGARYRVSRETETGRMLRQNLTARDILLVPRGQPHAVDWLRQAGVVSLNVAEHFADEAIDRSQGSLSDFFTVRDPFATAAAAELYAAMNERGSIDPLFAESLAVLIVSRVTTHAARRPLVARRTNGLTPLQLRRIERHISENIERRVSLEELANLAGVSRWHFLRQYQETTGSSPHAYVTGQRLQRAMDLLRTTDKSIMEIAAEVGMTHSHFSRRFAQHFGTSPSLFRRDHST